MLDGLLKAIKSNEMDVKDRFGLASDLLALAESGRILVSQFLAFFAELTNEDEYIVWKVVIEGKSFVSFEFHTFFRSLEILDYFGSSFAGVEG
jgi:hypothetical protein